MRPPWILIWVDQQMYIVGQICMWLIDIALHHLATHLHVMIVWNFLKYYWWLDSTIVSCWLWFVWKWCDTWIINLYCVYWLSWVQVSVLGVQMVWLEYLCSLFSTWFLVFTYWVHCCWYSPLMLHLCRCWWARSFLITHILLSKLLNCPRGSNLSIQRTLKTSFIFLFVLYSRNETLRLVIFFHVIAYNRGLYMWLASVLWWF